MSSLCRLLLLASLLCIHLAGLRLSAEASTLVIDFESVPLDPQGFDNGVNAGGSFDVDGAVFNNDFLSQSNAWSGWSFSQTTDTTTPGFLNQYSAYADLPDGGGAGGSSQYAVAFSGADGGSGGARPTIGLPEGALPRSVEITNTTYAALSILNGDGFARPFGNGDSFRLTIEAVNDQQQPVASLDVFLADYRNGQELLIDDWTEVDLTPLQVEGVTELQFRLASTDVGPFGINTPVYVAIDNLTLETPFSVDANDDGLVTGADYVLLRDTNAGAEAFAAFQAGFTGSSGGALRAAFVVPEPSTLPLVVGSLGFTAWGRRRSTNFPSTI